jgi:copper oxidase (laccase) domain-containing protein
VTVALTSALLTRHEFSHGFSLRTGGVSESPFDALNLARTVGDDPKAVAENYARFTAALGVEPAMLYEVSQVHGDSVRLIEKGESVTAVRNTDADALIAGPGQGAVGGRAPLRVGIQQPAKPPRPQGPGPPPGGG